VVVLAVELEEVTEEELAVEELEDALLQGAEEALAWSLVYTY